MTDFNILGIEKQIAPEREALLQHELYSNLNTIEDLRLFMQFHVFAVWDFMVLLKALQRRLTCVDEAWLPSNNRIARRLVNDIVLCEESDLDINGQPASHYEMYLAAMKQCGADTASIIKLISCLQAGHSHKSLVKYNIAELHQAQINFLRATYNIVSGNNTHEIAAAFTFAREDLIPDLFSQIVIDLDRKAPGQLSALIYYLDRHIELDGDEHGPMAHQMIKELCGNDQNKWQEAERASKLALQARLDFWDAINGALIKNRPRVVA